VPRVANGAFRGRADLVVLHIDESFLVAPVQYQNTDGGEELFPHVYGPVEASAVTKVSALGPGPDGTFRFP
jgi:uncharacterized protein (DUF952 family)